MSLQSNRSQHQVLPTVILLAPFIFSFAFALDVYIPAVPEMITVFHASQGEIQLTLSLFMLVVGLGQLIVGPFSDQYGRRVVAFFSVIVFTVSSLMCAFSPSINMLIAFRIAQAFGGCGMMVVAFAMVRDRFSDNESAKVYSFLNCGLAMSPLFAPIIGSYLDHWFGWKSGFIFLALMGAVIFLISLFKIKESLPIDKRVKFDQTIFIRYWRILTNPTFITFTLCASAGMSIFFTFFSSSPYIIIQLLHKPVKDFGYYFFLVGLTFFIGSLISGKISEKIGALKTVLMGASIMLCAGVLMLVWYSFWGLTIVEFMLPCMLAGVGGSFMMGAGAGGAMQPFSENTGAAAATLGCFEFLLASLTGSVIMHWQVLSTVPLSLTMITASVIALIALSAYIKTKE